MQLCIFEINPVLNAHYLIKNTNKSFVFKSLLELAQLVSTATNNGVYKPIKQGAELVECIKKYPMWTYSYFNSLFIWCRHNVNLSDKTIADWITIEESFSKLYINNLYQVPKTAIFRYQKEYSSDIETKIELNIKHCCEEYKKYIKWKMEK